MCGAVGLVFSHNRTKILLIKRRDVPIWDMPGGGKCENENPEECAVREVWEETGFRTKIIRKIAEYNNTWNGGIIYSYECEIIGGEKSTSDESKEVEFQDAYQLPKLRTLFVDQYVQDAMKESSHIIKADLKKIPLNFYIRKTLRHPIISLRYLLVYNGIHINT